MLYFRISVLENLPFIVSTFLYLESVLSNAWSKASLWTRKDSKKLLWQQITKFLSSVRYWKQSDANGPYSDAWSLHSLWTPMCRGHCHCQMPHPVTFFSNDNLKCKTTSTKFSQQIHSWDKYKLQLLTILQIAQQNITCSVS